MSPYHDLYHLKELLKDPLIFSDHQKSLEVINKISRYMNKGYDLQSLFILVVKLLSHNDIAVKKCVCQYIVNYAHEPSDVILLCFCSLVKETHSANPMVRGIALRTLASIRIESMLEYMTEILPTGLADKSAHVRRIAVSSCLSIYRLNNTWLSDNGYINRLYAMIRDSDPLVVVNCLRVLDEVLEKEGGIVMNKNMAYFLYNDLARFGDFHLTTVLQFLSKYVPENDDEVVNIVNLLDPYLQNNDISVAMAALKFVADILQNIPWLKEALFKRSIDFIVTVLVKGSYEDVYNLLDFLDEIPESLPVLTECVSKVYCKNSDPAYLKVKKLSLLWKMASEKTLDEINDELFISCLDNNENVVKSAMLSISHIIEKFPEYSGTCQGRLKDLVNLDVDHIILAVLDLVNELSQAKHDIVDIFRLIANKYTRIHNTPSQITFLHLLSHYTKDISDCPYIIENIIQDWLTESPEVDIRIQSAILTAVAKIFLVYPAQTLPSLQEVVETCWSSSDPELCDRTRMYYNLLLIDPHLAGFVIRDGTDGQ